MPERARGSTPSPAWHTRIGTWIVGWALQEPKHPLVRNPHLWSILLLFAGLTVLYYAEQLGLAQCLPGFAGFSNTVHDLHRALFFVPIIYSGLVFRTRGGLVACLACLLIMLPRAVAFSPYPHSGLRVVVFFVSATLITLLVTALLNQTERARAARAELADLHNELAESLVRLRESEEQLIQAEKLSSLGQMAASIAHEINNPLAGVLVYTQLLAKKLERGTLSPKTGLEYLAKMATEIDRSSRIIRNLLDFARPSALSLSDVDVNQVVEDAINLVEHRASLGQIELVRDLQPDLPKVYADYDQLRQVLVNLTLNAIQATAPDGRVVLRTHSDRDDGVLWVAVEDTGSGISEENQRMLFTPFFTTKEKGEGVGLGLAVAKGIIEKHAGAIEVHSVEGAGTSFVVRLPAQTDPGSQPTA